MTTQLQARLQRELREAERKALDSLGRYKFEMFGYWASAWVRLNRIEELNKPNPFKDLVILARRKCK